MKKNYSINGKKVTLKELELKLDKSRKVQSNRIIYRLRATYNHTGKENFVYKTYTYSLQKVKNRLKILNKRDWSNPYIIYTTYGKFVSKYQRLPKMS